MCVLRVIVFGLWELFRWKKFEIWQVLCGFCISPGLLFICRLDLFKRVLVEVNEKATYVTSMMFYFPTSRPNHVHFLLHNSPNNDFVSLCNPLIGLSFGDDGS